MPMLQKKSPGGRRGFYLHTHWEGVRFKAEPVGNPLFADSAKLCRSHELQNGGMIGPGRPGRYRASLKVLSMFCVLL